MMVTSLTPELRTHFGAPADRGVLVARVAPGTPAAAAGIEVGDVIVGVRGQKIDDGPDVLAALADLGKGAHARLELVRDGKSRTVDATLAGDPVFQDRMTPFGEPSWFREWLKPFEQAKRGTDLPQTSEWLDKLRELFAPKTNQAQRS
jgi:predicted metalloprotease with PDZ domain